MKKYIKPEMEINLIAASEIASSAGLAGFLEEGQIYEPGITTFNYNS